MIGVWSIHRYELSLLDGVGSDNARKTSTGYDLAF